MQTCLMAPRGLYDLNAPDLISWTHATQFPMRLSARCFGDGNGSTGGVVSNTQVSYGNGAISRVCVYVCVGGYVREGGLDVYVGNLDAS